jgi:hypothetical protein
MYWPRPRPRAHIAAKTSDFRPVNCYTRGMIETPTPHSFIHSLMKPFGNKLIRSVAIGIAVVLIAVLAGTGYSYASSPAPVRQPSYEHLHFRLQVLVDGKAVDFASKKFQEGYAKDNCNVDLTVNPFHFHDGKDQFAHVHWKGMSGGLLLKYYGWNYIGGVDGMLGTRFDDVPNLVTVPIHGNALPKVADKNNFYVYTGDEKAYQQRDFDEFIDKDIEGFFGKKSLVDSEPVTWLDKLFPKAAAHGDEVHAAGAHDLTAEDLERINNLVGNVVIFSQKDKPTDQQIKDRFNKLAPLSESTCAG